MRSNTFSIMDELKCYGTPERRSDTPERRGIGDAGRMGGITGGVHFEQLAPERRMFGNNE
nr:MAG TPA: hypothetical protein [Caudoviricetes sp.]